MSTMELNDMGIDQCHLYFYLDAADIFAGVKK